MEWVDGNIGSKVTMKYPAVWMTGEHAKGEVLSIAFAGEGQHQDAGAKMVHAAPHTSSTIVVEVGRPRRRPHLLPRPGADRRGRHGSKSTVKCDALLVDTISRSDTYPYVDVREDDVSMGHEATVSKVSDDQLFYLMSRGLTEDEAMAMIVRGFVEPIARELPDGVRPRAQPADRAADGRCRRLMSAPATRHAKHSHPSAAAPRDRPGRARRPRDATVADRTAGRLPTGSAGRSGSPPSTPTRFGVPTGREEDVALHPDAAAPRAAGRRAVGRPLTHGSPTCPTASS